MILKEKIEELGALLQELRYFTQEDISFMVDQLDTIYEEIKNIVNGEEDE